MCKFLGLVLLVLGVSSHASIRIFSSSGAQLGIKSEVQCSTGMSCSISGGKLVMATTSLGLRTQVASTTTILTAAQCGSTIVSDSADVVTLPEASTVLGCRYSFVCGTADDFDINPNDGTDQILPVTASGGTISPSAGDAVRCTDAGAGITLEAIGANAWAAISHNGAITDVN